MISEECNVKCVTAVRGIFPKVRQAKEFGVLQLIVVLPIPR